MDMSTNDWEVKKAARAFSAKQLQAANPHLVAANPNCSSLVAAAKNIRTELKAAFPGVKFGVRSSRFSGGDSIHVDWTDGPNTKQVDSVIDRYSAGNFDGMIDLYTYSHSNWTDAFGDAKYVQSSRHYSDATVQAMITKVCDWLGGVSPIPTVEDYRQGRLYLSKQSGGCDVQREVNVALSDFTTFAGKPAEVTA